MKVPAREDEWSVTVYSGLLNPCLLDVSTWSWYKSYRSVYYLGHTLWRLLFGVYINICVYNVYIINIKNTVHRAHVVYIVI